MLIEHELHVLRYTVLGGGYYVLRHFK